MYADLRYPLAALSVSLPATLSTLAVKLETEPSHDVVHIKTSVSITPLSLPFLLSRLTIIYQAQTRPCFMITLVAGG